MYKRIVVPLDGSELAEQILPYVRVLATALQAKIQLVRVYENMPDELADPAHGLDVDQLATSFREREQGAMGGVVAALSDLGVEVVSSAHEGDPAHNIVVEAEAQPDTLIAMSTHGRTGLGRWFLGSVTDKVLHATNEPLLIVRSDENGAAGAVGKLETVIVPLDGSPLAEQTLTHVVPLARSLSLKVLLVRANPSAEEVHRYMEPHPIGGGATVYSGPFEEFSREADARAMGYLHDVRQKIVRQRVFSTEERLLRGHAASVIIDLAHQTPNCLIAMSTHGRSGVGRWVLGSVADRVIRHCGRPVLVTRSAPGS